MLRKNGIRLIVFTLSAALFLPLSAPALGLSSGRTITFSGHGWGHGVGLCQWGAKGMAEAGYTYDQILTHYYTGCVIQEAASSPAIKIGILTNQTEIHFAAPGGLNIEMAGAILATAGPNEVWRVRLSGMQYQLVAPNGLTMGPYVYPIRFVPRSGRITLPQKTSYSNYRGSMISQITSNGLTAINELPLEEYLYGCVPSEMPFNWPAEALKAQALAARNYAVKNMGKHGSYDLCATTHCQVYLGADHEKSSTTSAVNETKGRLITYQASPISAYYHSTCGGSTENSENVWSNALGYLKAVPCPFCAGSPHRDWRVSFTASELEAKLRGDPETAVQGSLLGIEISSLRGERRVGAVKLTGSEGATEVSAAKIRRVLGTSLLKSTWFSILGGEYGAMSQSIATMRIGEAGYRLNDIFTKADAAPYIKGGRAFVPVRYLANALGIADSGIGWNAFARTVNLTKGSDSVSLSIGSKNLLKNTITILMDVPCEIASGRTMLPARWVAEAFGGNVAWDAASKTVTIIY